MSLINCPECNKQISDKSEICIHCGFPIQKELTKSKENNMYDMIFKGFTNPNSKSNKYLIKSILATSYNISKTEGEKLLSQPESILIKGVRFENINTIKENFLSYGCVIEAVPTNDNYINPRNENLKQQKIKADSPVTCPRCHSTSITTGQRGYKLTTGFFGSNKTVNRCAKCGYTWKPKL